MGVRTRILVTFGVGSLVLSGVLSFLTYTLTRSNLREREGDVPLLAQEFLSRFRQLYGAGADRPTGFDPLALACLNAYTWPGNVRELQNVIERVVALAEGPTIRVEHLPDRLRAAHVDEPSSEDPTSYKQAKQEVVRSFERHFLLELLNRHDWHMKIGRAHV